eukprot:TRINITY_DN2004_c0_g2_i6.p1 TRINITY_DN2004_c0_g2~~TRINITY_DN2004_c0_g2_i6.p1  ORF type:complete len:361 (+),score=63.27 TRINITY_DN2004_c0_g2_i6:243-1325(+)
MACHLLFMLSVLCGAAASTHREVRWWMGFGAAANNLKLIDTHPKAITGIYTYIGASVDNSGAFSCTHNATYLRSQFMPYWERGLTVTPALALSNESVINGNAAKQVTDVAEFALSINASGLMLDFEPATSDPSWVHAYASYVGAFSAAMHTAGLQAEMCVAGWGILDGHEVSGGYAVYAHTGVDLMMSMSSTYFGTNITKNLAAVDTELNQNVSIDQLAVGIGTQIDPSLASCPAVPPMGCKTPGGQCYNWSEPKLEAFVDGLDARGTSKIAIWRADIDAEGDCTEPYYFAVAEKFLAADRGELDGCPASIFPSKCSECTAREGMSCLDLMSSCNNRFHGSKPFCFDAASNTCCCCPTHV